MTSKNKQTTDEGKPSEDLSAENAGSKDTKSEKPKYDPEELLRIFDEIIFSGEYQETISFRGGKLKVIFRSRSADDIVAISKEIDNGKFNLISTMQEARAILNLSYSLVEYAGKDYSKVDPDERKKIIGKLSGVIVGLLSEALSKFDDKVAAACLEGKENF